MLNPSTLDFASKLTVKEAVKYYTSLC